MLNAVIRFALTQRIVVMAAAVGLLAGGLWQSKRLPIDVFPDLNRPRVVVITEAAGLAPEEIEALITFPIETAVNGANGVQVVRSSSAAGISIVYVEFNWGTDIYTDRQIVNERLQLVQDRMPLGVAPQLAPISSIMGQVLMLGMWSDGRVEPLELRTLADWVVRPRLLTIPGVSQVFTMGGGRLQFQVLVDPDSLLKYGVTLGQVKQAVGRSNLNATGGYLDRQGPRELLVRALGRIHTIEDLRSVEVTIRNGRPVSLAQVARVVEAPQVKRGDSAAFVRGDDGRFSGGPAVVLTINKQPGADTVGVTRAALQAVDNLRSTLPAGLHIEPVYSQQEFIDRAIENVVAALRDGGLLVLVILFLFLLNVRTTLISLTAIPLSLAITILVFSACGLTINTMTLGGLAVAIGELVDDAIVDVENIFRRLNENRRLARPRPALQVVYSASAEVRNSIVFSTAIICLVFVPLFALSGMEGRLFTPLGTAYVVSILASLAVSLTVTPVLSYWLLSSSRGAHDRGDGFVLRGLKRLVAPAIRFSLAHPVINIAGTLALFLASGFLAANLDRDFLPAFNEGAIQLDVLLPPGTSLATSLDVNLAVERRLQENSDVLRFVRRTGRAELDEHADPVSSSEYIIELDAHSSRDREQQLERIRDAMREVPGIVTAVEQPLAHLISHMLSGVKAQIGIKLYGDDLALLRRNAAAIRAAAADVRGVADLLIEPQVVIPQLRIELDRQRLLENGLTPADVNEFLQTALQGDVVSQVLIGQRAFDLLVRFDDDSRENLETLKRLSIELPEGGRVPLQAVASIYESGGPNLINRENVRRRIIIQCNVVNRGVVDVVEDIQRRIAPLLGSLPAGSFVEFGGQFESQQAAVRRLSLLSLVSLTGVFLVLYLMFRSVNLALQVMTALPMAFIGAIVALVVTKQTLTVAAMVGLISLTGIASRNGILLLNHYLHLVRHEGEDWTKPMIVRAGLERLAPVVMTALTAGIGLVPLVLAAGEPGKEILYPVATVILGGLVSSTLLDFLIHPALFWLFGVNAARRVIDRAREDEVLLLEAPVDRE